MENALKGLGTQGKSAGSALGSMATQVAAAGVVVGGVLVAGVAKAVGVFASFESGMSDVASTGVEAQSRLGELSAAAIKLGQDTTLAGIGAADAAAAMAELARGGVSVTDQLGGATRGALLLASAGAISVGEAAGIATKAMNIFSLSGSDVAHVADLMSAGANKSATDVAQLGAAFNQSAAVAKNAGLSIEELTGTLAFLAQRGMEGSDAGTSLKTALLALQAPTDKAAETLAELGINVRDANGEMLPFADIADVLKDRLSGLSAAQRDAALKTIFGNDAIRIGIALYEGGGAAIRDWTAQVDDAGNAARTGAIKNDNLKGSLDQLKAVFETAAIQVGAKFAPAVRTAADELGKFVTKAMASPEVTKALEDLGTKGAAAITRLVAKVSDPAFQQQLKEWGTAALDVGKAIASLAGDVADTLGPPLKAAAEWFNSLDEGGKKNVVTFGLVALAAVKFRDELGTLLSVGNSVISMFTRKAAEKAKLTGANNLLAGSAGRTAAAMTAVRVAAAAATPEIAAGAAILAGTAVAAVGVSAGFGALAGAMDQTGQRARDNAQAWDAASFAIANGATQANGAVDGFTRLVVATGETAPSVARLSVLWNQYVGSLQASGQSTSSLGLNLINLAQFITGQVAPAFESAANAGVPFNNTLAGLGSAAMALGNSLPTMGAGAATATAAFAAGVTEASNYSSTLAELEANGIVTTTAVARSAQAVTEFMIAIQAAQGPTTATAAALSDLNTFGTSAQQGLNAAASAALGAAMAFDRTNESLARLGQAGGQLGGYLNTLQSEWDALDAATKAQGNTTAAQAARYAELAPLIQYLNAQLGVNKDNTVAATEEAVRNLQAIDQTSGAYATAAAAAQQAAGAVGQSATATTNAGMAATIAAIKYDEFGQSVGAVPPVVPVDTSAAQTAATIASIKYNEFGQAIDEVPKAITTSVDATAATVAAGMMAGLRIAVVSVPTSINIVANVDISGALNQIQQLRNNMPSSPAKEGPFRKLPDFSVVLDTFEPAINQAVALVEKFGAAFAGIDIDFAKKASEASSSVSGAIKGAVDALKALSGLDLAKDMPTAGQASGLIGFVTGLTAQIAEAARAFSEEGLKAAGSFADTASKVVGLVGNAVSAFTSLGKYTPIATSAIYDFGKTLRALMNDFALIAEQVTQEAADAASAFATGASAVVDVVGKGADAFTKLGTYVAIPVAAIYAFGKTLRAVVNDFALLAEQVTQEATDAAARFASGAGTVVDTVGKGVSAFLLLSSFVAPGVAAIYEFGKTLRAVVNDLALVAEQVTQEAAESASLFAASAGAVVGIIGAGVEGFTKLLTFVAPSQEAIDNFVYAVFAAVRKIAEMASQMSTEGVAMAGEFGTAANSVLSALKTGLDVFTGLAKLVVPSAKAIDDFAIAIAYTVSRIGTIADQLGKDGIKRATEFGQSVQTIFGALKASMDILTNLEKFKDVAAKAFDSLLVGMQEAIDRAQGMVQFAKNLVTEAEQYRDLMSKAAAIFNQGMSLGGSPQRLGESIGEGIASGARQALDANSPSQVMAAIGRDVIDGLVQGMSDAQQDAAKKAADVASAVAKAIQDTLGAATALGTLDLTTLPTSGQIGGILAFTRALVAEMAASATMLSEDGVKATTLFADAASKVAGAVSAGLDALGKLVGFVPPTAARIRDAADAIGAVVADLAIVADRVTVDAATLAGQFAEGASKVLDLVGKGAASFAGVFAFAKPENYKGVYYLHQAIEAAVNDLAEIAARVTLDSSDLAGKFADGAAKVVGLVGAGVAAFKDVFTFAKPENFKGIYYLDQAIEALVNDLAEVAERVTVDSADLAGKFADGVSKVLGLLTSGVAGFKALDGFVSPALASLSAFVDSTYDLTKLMVAAALGFGTDGLKAASDFADAAGKALGIIGNATNFKVLAEFAAPAESRMDAFVGTVRALVKQLVAVGQDFAEDGLKAANLFADTGGKAVSMIGGAVGGFAGLSTFVTPGRAAVDGLMATIRYVVQRFGEMAVTMSTEGVAQTTAFGTATQAVLGGVKMAIDTFIALDKAVVPQTGDLSDLVVAVQGVTRNMAAAAALLGDKAIADATAFGTAAQGIFTALKSGLDLFIQIDKPGGWPSTDWLQPLIELMSGVLLRGGQLLTQSQQLKAIADQFSANLMQAGATFGSAMGLGDWALTGNVGGGGGASGGGGGTVINNYYTVTGNTLLSKDTGTQQMVTGIVTATQGRTISYATSG